MQPCPCGVSRGHHNAVTDTALETIPEDVQKLMREFIESEHLTSELQKGMNEGYICIDVDDVGYLKCDTIPVICKVEFMKGEKANDRIVVVGTVCCFELSQEFFRGLVCHYTNNREYFI